MQRVLVWILSLGNAGAIENARAVLDQRRAEEFAVRSLDRRINAAARPAA